MTENHLITKDELYKVCTQLFMKEGLSSENADILVSSLLEADLRGTSSHGVVRIENYIKRLRQGGAVANAVNTILYQTPTTVVMDGNNGLGAIVSHQACEIVRKKALENKLAFGVVKESNHFGAASRWAFELAGDDMIGIAGSNVHALMVALGSRKPAIGNNPFAVVVPADKYGSVCLDMACSTVAGGKVLEYRHKNMPLPDGWFVDEEGNNTNDPFKGMLVTPFGGHKGFGIAVIVEILSSLLSGGAFGDGLGNQYEIMNKPNHLSHFFIAIRIDAFRDPAGFNADVDAFIDHLKATPRKDDCREIYYPGELEKRRHAVNLIKGIVLEASLADELAGIARENGVDEDLVACLKAHPLETK